MWSVLVRVLQRNGTNRIYLDSRCIIRIGSQFYGRHEVTQSLCHLQLENQWYNSVWIQKLENPDTNGEFPGLSLKAKNQEHWRPRSKGRRRWIFQLKQRDRKFTLPQTFCSVQVLIRLLDAHPHWWGWSLLSLLIQMLTDTLTGHTQKSCLTAIWAFLAQSSWHIKTKLPQIVMGEMWNYC